MNTSPAFRPLPSLAGARAEPVPGLRLQKLRRAALDAREAFVREGPVAAVATCDLVTFPYPAQFAFSGAASSPAPYVMLTNRMQVVQFVDREGARRTLLFNPSDYERGVSAPFYRALRERYGAFVSDKVMSTRHGSVQSHLAALGLIPADVDYRPSTTSTSRTCAAGWAVTACPRTSPGPAAGAARRMGGGPGAAPHAGGVARPRRRRHPPRARGAAGR
ncbi:hypothetical protein QEG98_26975 [Myxococcus sp. MxC21-1]|nr:hypothetical protein QEG98_26975 [Myxococcus sp. MxC21-1]